MTAAVAHTPPGRVVGDAGHGRAPVVEYRTGRDRARGAGQWPPERQAAVRLVRARQNLDRAAALGDPRAQALARRHIDVVEADARTCLSRPAPVGAEADEQAAAERARAGLARMLDPDPVTRTAGADDLTRAWPAEHLDLLRTWAEHQQRQAAGQGPAASTDATDGVTDGDAVARARAAVAAIPAAELTDPDEDAVGRSPHAPVDSDGYEAEGWSR